MDRNTTLVWMLGLSIVGGGIYWMANASNRNTQLKTLASVAKAQEHTRRAEGRHDLLDIMGALRGWDSQRKRNNNAE